MYGVPKDFYVSPLLQSLSARGRILIKVWCFFQKAKNFIGNGRTTN